MFVRCPKCGHDPLPSDQTLPAACPACGVILAKLQPRPPAVSPPVEAQTPAVTTTTRLWWRRAALLAAFAVWGLYLIGRDVREAEIGNSFIHGPLLVFHEAGHVLMRPFGEWLMVAGGTLGQLAMPALLTIALLVKNRDAYGASFGLWLVGVSLLDVAPYMYDAQQPVLVLLSGTTGEEGSHDWIYLFSSMGLLQSAQRIGLATRALGAAVVLAALGWGAWTLRRRR